MVALQTASIGDPQEHTVEIPVFIGLRAKY